MGESQDKASSSVNSQEKSSLLDFDIGKDFLSNWKPKSGGEDDVMDLDFGPVTKNKKKTFDFDKVDIDFNLDGDFGNLSSFNIDMSDFDVSSPLKKDGKHNEKSKEASGRGSNKGKADSFDFSFDFNKLDSFTFESSSRKDKDTPKDQDKGRSPSRSDCQGSRVHMTKEVGVLEDGISQKPTASGVVSSSNTNLQDGGRAHATSTNEYPALKSVKDDNGPSKSMNGIEEVALLTEENSPQKPIPVRIQQTDCQPEQTSSAGPVTQEIYTANATLPELLVPPASGTDSSGDTTSELQEEVCSMDTKMNISDGEHDASPSKSIDQAKRSTSNSCGNSKLSLANMASIQIMKKTSLEGKSAPIKSAQRTDLTGIKISRFDSFTFKSSSEENKNAVKNQDEGCSPSTDGCQSSKMHLTEDKSVLKDGISQKTIASGILRSSDVNLQHGGKAHLDSISEDVTLKSVRSEKGPSKSVTAIKEVALQEEETSTQKPIPTGIQKTVIHPEKTSSSGRDSQEACTVDKIKPDIAVRSASTSDNTLNPKRLLPNMAPTQTMRNTSLKGENSLIQPTRGTPNLTAVKISRTFKPNLNSSRSMFEKETKSMGTSTPNKFPLGETPAKVSQLNDPRMQTLSTISLKRKTPEADDADSIISNPSKRFSESPRGSRNIVETSEKVVNKEVCKNLAGHNTRSVLENFHASPVNVLQETNMKELESPYTIEDDSNIEKAEACSKELEDICNMLKKKHDEAKEILVRAIVNNNKLLMLNHPLYEENIRMIQKFAAGLTLTKRCATEVDGI